MVRPASAGVAAVYRGDSDDVGASTFLAAVISVYQRTTGPYTLSVGGLILVEQVDQLPLVPHVLRKEGGEFCASFEMTPSMVTACCRLGYLPMAHHETETALLLIKCHEERMVLRFPELHLGRSVRRRMRKHRWVLTVDGDFERVLSGIQEAHDSSWFTHPLCEVFRQVHDNPSDGVSLHSVELYGEDGELAAAEIGYRCGRVYTSLSGYYLVDGAGAVQTAALALLESRGFAFWDLGMDVPYKRDLGAQAVERYSFLQEYRREATFTPPSFPEEAVECRCLPGVEPHTR
jgi:Leu/Phe-tRNA-protein transferase